MKRLKLKYPFRGYESKVMTAAVMISPLAGLAVLTLTENKHISYIIPSVLAAFILTLIAAYLIFSHTDAEEKYLIEQAEEIQWNTPDDWIYDAVKAKYRIPWSEIGIFGGGFGVIVLVFAFTAESPEIVPWLLTAFAVPMLILITVHAVLKKRWSAIDETAECAVLTADHTYTVKTHGKRKVYIDEFYVFYTHEGRLVLKKTETCCRRVCIIKFNGMITYVEYAEKRRYTYSRL